MKEPELTLYRVDDNYISYLHSIDNKVLENKFEKRPYVGFVYLIDTYNYFIPLSSPKSKHLNMKNTLDFHKIDGGNYGALNINNMIPIREEFLIDIDIIQLINTDPAYGYLLANQYAELKKIKNVILGKSVDIYSMYFKDYDKLSKLEKKIKKRCCKFDKLEAACESYIALQQAAIGTPTGTEK